MVFFAKRPSRRLRPPPTARASAADVASLFREHFDFVWRTIRAFGVPPGSVDDAVQEVFLTVHRKLPEFEGRSAVRTWLYSIAYLTAQNHRRKGLRHAWEPLQDEAVGQSPRPDEQLGHRQAGQFVDRFIEQLSETKRQVFVLAIVEQLPAPEVAALLELNVNTVYSKIRSVRAEFRAALDRFATSGGAV